MTLSTMQPTRILALSAVVFLWTANMRLLAGGTNCAPVPSAQVSWWRAEGSGTDFTGNNPGVATNGLTFASGKVGSAFNFDGANSDFQVPASASLDVGPDEGLTIEAWINPANVNSMPIADYSPIGTYGAHFWIVDGAGIHADLFDTANTSHHLL